MKKNRPTVLNLTALFLNISWYFGWIVLVLYLSIVILVSSVVSTKENPAFKYLNAIPVHFSVSVPEQDPNVQIEDVAFGFAVPHNPIIILIAAGLLA